MKLNIWSIKALAGLLVLLVVGILAIYVREGGLNLSGARAPLKEGEITAVIKPVGKSNLDALKFGDRYVLEVFYKSKPFKNRTIGTVWSVPSDISPEGCCEAMYATHILNGKGQVEFTVNQKTHARAGNYILSGIEYLNIRHGVYSRIEVIDKVGGGADWSGPISSAPQLGALLVEAVPVGKADLGALTVGDKYRIRVLFQGKPFKNRTVEATWYVPFFTGESYPCPAYNPQDVSPLPCPGRGGVTTGVTSIINSDYRLNGKGEIELTVSDATVPGNYVLESVEVKNSVHFSRPAMLMHVLGPGEEAGEAEAELGKQIYWGIGAVGLADLDNLKPGDKYYIQAWRKDGYINDTIKTTWEFNGQISEVSYKLDEEGRIELTVKEGTKPGTYIMKTIEYNGYVQSTEGEITVVKP